MAERCNAELIFAQQWWWKAVCQPPALRLFKTPSGSCWPIAKIRRMGLFNVYAMPPLTQHTGPYLADRKDFISLLEQIPSKAQVCLNVGFKLNETEEAMVQQQGFKVVERHSHRIEDLFDLNQVFANIKPAQQRQIRKAQRTLKVVRGGDIEQLIRLQSETFRRRAMAMPFSAENVRRLYQAIVENQAGTLISLLDTDENVMACGLFVHDHTSCYSLTHGFHKTAQNLGAGSLLQWEGIRYAAEKKLIFDFEGSDIESIAKFNLSFGAIPETYSRLERYSTFFRIMERLWRYVKKMRRYL